MILKEIIDLVDIALKSMNKTYKDVKMCELGNQHCDIPNENKIGKYLMLDRGVSEHVTIDINGEDGAERYDMEKPLSKWNKYFDIVTNYGSTEHMEEQFQVFKNIHNMVKSGGAVVHVVPNIGDWPCHCPVYYDLNFFQQLAILNQYETIYGKLRTIGKGKLERRLLCCVYQLSKNNDFISEEEFSKIKPYYVNYENKKEIDSIRKLKTLSVNK